DGTDERQPPASSLRDRNVLSYATTLDPSSGPARVDVPPQAPPSGPQLEGRDTTDAAENVLATGGVATNTNVFFPERVVSVNGGLSAVRPQTWTITWEGDLFGPGFAGQITSAPPAPAADAPPAPTMPAKFSDRGVNFCQVGTLAHDVISIVGCTDDSQCGPLRVCKRSETAPQTVGSLPINGLCVDRDSKAQADGLMKCAPLLETVRRYEIQTMARNHARHDQLELSLLPKLDEIP